MSARPSLPSPRRLRARATRYGGRPPQESDCVSNRRQEPAQVGFPEVTIAVVGEENAGKSSFIRRALDLKTTPAASSSKKKMSLDGSVYIVRMLEVDLKEVRLGSKKNILWPKSSPRIDGALVLHDATEPEKLEEMTDLLGASTQASPRAHYGLTVNRLPGCHGATVPAGGVQMRFDHRRQQAGAASWTLRDPPYISRIATVAADVYCTGATDRHCAPRR